MSLLNAGYLFGLLAVAVPVLIHILQRDRVRRIVFPATRFLLGASRKITRTQRLRELILMLLRAAAVLLLVLALCRPFFSPAGSGEGAPAAGATVTVLVLDRSASMRIGQRMEEAKRQALAKLRALRPGLDRAALVTFDESARVVAAPSGDFTEIERALDELKPGHGGTNLVAAMQQADRLLQAQEFQQSKREVAVYTDLPRAGWEAYDGEWRFSPGVQVSIRPVSVTPAENVAITQVAMPRSTVTSPRSEAISVRLVNFSPREKKNLPVSLFFAGKLAEKKFVNVRPGKSEIVRFRHKFERAGDDFGRITVKTGDDFADDDTYHFNVRVLPRIRVLLINGGPHQKAALDDGHFLKAALNVPGTPFLLREIHPDRLAEKDLEQVDAVVLTNVPLLREPLIGRLRSFLNDGGGVLIFPGDRTRPEVFNKTLARLAPCKLKQIVRKPRESEGVPIAKIEFQHPIFRPFATPNSGDLGKARFHQYFMVSDSQAARVLARFLDGRPALLEKKFGKEKRGVSLLFTSTAGLKWNNLCLQGGLFVPLMHEAVRYLAVRGEGVRTAQVGQPMVLQVQSDQGSVRPPEGEAAALKKGAASFVPSRPGLHLFTDGKKAERFAVNLDPRESDPAMLDPEELVSAISSNPEGEQVRIAGAKVLLTASASVRERIERGQQWGRYLLLVLLVLLIGEHILANNTSRN